jgi:hypothetical protein
MLPAPGRQRRRKAVRQRRTATGASAETASNVTMRRGCLGGAEERGARRAAWRGGMGGRRRSSAGPGTHAPPLRSAPKGGENVEWS